MSDGGWTPRRRRRYFDTDPTPIKASLDILARRFGGATSSGLQGIFSEWTEVVGAPAAAHAQPVSLRDGRLRVAVDHAAWATSLRHLEAAVLERLEAVAGPGVVTAIDLVVRPR